MKDLFEDALAREPAQRPAFLAAACGEDHSVREQVERLLAAHEGAGSFLERPPPALIAFDALQKGQTLSHFQIVEKIGEGGMGVVYRAIDMQLRRPVAIKVIRPDAATGFDSNRRLLREARAASALNHPNIAHIYEVSEAASIRFIAMEFVEGRTLESLIAAGPLGLADLAALGAQAADALAEAHAHGVIHRDIKPSNLMIGPRGELKVLDFGLAKMATRADTGDTALTGGGVLMGTIHYMSPEQFLGQEVDCRSDIFSLGLALYELAAGRKAFRGDGVEVIDQILHATLPRLPQSPALDRIVRRCVEKQPEKRYQSAAQLADDLRGLSLKPPGSDGIRLRVRLTLAAVCLLAVAWAGAIYQRKRSGPLREQARLSERATVPRWDPANFRKIAAFGEPAAGGGSFTNDFEPYALNDRGDLAFAADVTTGRDGVFLVETGGGPARLLARAGAPAPGGGTFDGGILCYESMNDSGDVAFVFGLKPFDAPQLKGFANAGLFRYSRSRQELAAVVIPGVTAAPGFGVFQSVGQHASLNNSGYIVFPGVIRTSAGVSPERHLGQGIFVAHPDGVISKVVAPGDPAPGGGVFDYLVNPWINDAGEIAFGGHVAAEDCISIALFGPGCAESIYLMGAGSTTSRSIAHQGDQAAGGGFYRWAWGPLLNNRGEVAFMGELIPTPGVVAARGIFLNTRGITQPIARPGSGGIMPDGRKIVTVNPGFAMGSYSLNDHGDVSFTAALEGGESALYVHSKGSLHLVAGTGTTVPGVGTILSVGSLLHGGILNNRGQILFWAVLTDGNGVLLLATPGGN